MARKKRPERFKIQEFVNASGTHSWRVSGTKIDGTRVRKNHKDQTEAVDEKADLEKEAAGAKSPEVLRKTILSEAQLSDAEAATQAYRWGSIAAVVSHYRQLEERVPALDVTLDEAVRYSESHYRPEQQEMSIEEARSGFIKSRQGLRPHTVAHYEHATKHLLKPDPGKPVHKFTVTDLEEILGRFKNANTIRTFRRSISVVFEWAVRHHYCPSTPADAWTDPRRTPRNRHPQHRRSETAAHRGNAIRRWGCRSVYCDCPFRWAASR